MPPASALDVDAFIARWTAADGSERANYQLFVGELCALLGVEPPQPAKDDAGDNAYSFERRVIFRHGDGTSSHGFIDCYRRGAFVLEAKKLKAGGARSFDDALMRARAQAEGYARALPADEGRPPFLVVVDVGNIIELYAEFSRSGATYTPYPDPRSHRIPLTDLRRTEVRARLAAVWLDPLSLDPTRQSARVTREIAAHLAEVAKSLEAAGHAPETVAGFLTRCLFSMFAEDVELIPKGSFTELLHSFKEDTGQFVPLLGALWQEMDRGGFSVVLRRTLPRFNGKLFKAPTVLPLTREQIALLIGAARADWTQVEPAIFGTLLERALDPRERHALGAHYTPRAYVERLVLPTVIEPLRRSWEYVQAAALILANDDKDKEAIAELRAFHKRLCELRVLDPACGSGNFLYVTLEHMKRLEGEVLNQLHEFGHGQAQLETEGFAVDPHQFLGLEINPRAAAIAELVLWIGYLQWHFRTRGAGLPPQPVLRDFRNIECRDAVLAYDSVDYVTDERGLPVTRWNGRTAKPHPVTGEQVPDETARVPLERYINPRRAVWPQADVVVGNPPFIGNKRMRLALGDGYVDALRSVWGDVPDSADFVMFWWHKAAELMAAGELSRFGFITTNSITQAFNRRVVQAALDDGLHLAYAIADHPWVDSADGAAVRIAMTVGTGGEGEGRLLVVTDECDRGNEGLDVTVSEQGGVIHADLTIGAHVAGAQQLRANLGLACPGVQLSGQGFLIPRSLLDQFDHRTRAELVRHYVTGRDLTQERREQYVLDTFGFTDRDLLRTFPIAYQWLSDRVRPERQENPREKYRRDWWLHAEPRRKFRNALAGLTRFIVTSRTAKHRTFQFLAADHLPESKVLIIASADAFVLGILSSATHMLFADAAGGKLGAGNDSTYNHSDCLEKFPFPTATPDQQARIRALAEELDAHRKRQQALHADLTLTGMYNVLEKLKSGEALNAKEKSIHDKGLVGVLRQLHDELDAAVAEAYGWRDRPNDDAILERLVALNAERAHEEAQGRIRWLRPNFQNRAQADLAEAEPSAPTICDSHEEVGAALPPPPARAKAPPTNGRKPWPPTLPEQVAAIAQAFADAQSPLTLDQLAERFTGKGPWKKRLPQLLDTLAVLGKARLVEDGRWMG